MEFLPLRTQHVSTDAPMDDQARLPLAAYAVIVPSVSIGNIGQLAVDLLVHNYPGGCSLVGYLDHDAVPAMVGRNAFAEDNENGGIAMNLEVYRTNDARYIIVQQRAPVVTGHAKQFTRDLLEWARAQRFSSMLVVAGLDASTRFDCQLHLDASADRLRVVAPVDTNGDILAQVMRAFPRATAIKQLEETPVPDYRRQLCGDANAATERITVGSGALAKHLVELATISDSDATSTLPPFACLFVYGVEGNNIPEAAILARAALDMMGGGSGHNGEVQQQQQQASIKFRLPASWQYMYGGSMDTLLYQ